MRGSTGQKLDVVFGGGRRMFSPVWVEDLETRQPGLRGDFDLIAEWTADKVLHHCHVNDLANIVISILRYCKTLAMLSSHQEVTWKELQKSLLIVSLACSPLRR